MRFQNIKNILHIGFLIIINSLMAQQESFAEIDDLKTDSIYLQLNKDIAYFTENNDTLQIIDTRIKRIKFYSAKGFYSNGYDEVWASLPLVEAPKFITQKIEILDRLITLYIVFQQQDKAHESYNKAIALVNSNPIKDNVKSQLLGRLYNLGAWIEIRLTLDYAKAEALALKSVEYYENTTNTIPVYSRIQLAHIYLKKNELEKAERILFDIKKEYPLPLQSVHALLYERIGQYYDIKKERDSAIYYFKTSLEAIDKFEIHPDKKLLVSKKLSENYLAVGDFKLAHKYLMMSSDLNDQLFNSNKSQNKELFEIKNKYEVELKESNEALKTQKIKLLENEKEFWRLKILVIIALLCSLFGLIVFYFKRKSKIKILNQSLINQSQKLEIEKQNVILELKNKELLTSALQLLERDTLQEDLKKQLSKLKVQGDNVRIVNDIKNALNIISNNKWEEFQSHFTKVNDGFFTSLKQRFPLLTPTDLKMCAFIKLGFSSKDMAQIMGISVEGINTSRSRLRKKMNLPRKTILSEFLQDYSKINTLQKLFQLL